MLPTYTFDNNIGCVIRVYYYNIIHIIEMLFSYLILFQILFQLFDHVNDKLIILYTECPTKFISVNNI